MKPNIVCEGFVVKRSPNIKIRVNVHKKTFLKSGFQIQKCESTSVISISCGYQCIHYVMSKWKHSTQDPASTSTSPPPLLAHTSRLATRRLVSTLVLLLPSRLILKIFQKEPLLKLSKKSFFGRLLTVSLLLRNKEIYLYFYKVLYIFRVNDFQYLISTQYLQNQYI